MSTADIIAVLRREAEWWYEVGGNHVRADALRRAAKRLGRLEDGWERVSAQSGWVWIDKDHDVAYVETRRA